MQFLKCTSFLADFTSWQTTKSGEKHHKNGHSANRSKMKSNQEAVDIHPPAEHQLLHKSHTSRPTQDRLPESDTMASTVRNLSNASRLARGTDRALDDFDIEPDHLAPTSSLSGASTSNAILSQATTHTSNATVSL
jgi:hypothetical protein